MTYTYNPAKITEWSMDRMRFELGDTQIEGGRDTCALCDEEYAAVIGNSGQDATDWRRVKIKCLKVILARFSMMVDFQAGGMTIELSQRYERWKELLRKEQSKEQTLSSFASSSGDGGHYFWFGQHDNARVSHPPFSNGG